MELRKRRNPQEGQELIVKNLEDCQENFIIVMNVCVPLKIHIIETLYTNVMVLAGRALRIN